MGPVYAKPASKMVPPVRITIFAMIIAVWSEHCCWIEVKADKIIDEKKQLQLMNDTVDRVQSKHHGSKEKVWRAIRTNKKRITENKNQLGKLSDEIAGLKKELHAKIDDVQKELFEIKESTTALCGYQHSVGGSDNNGLLGDTIIYAEAYKEVNGIGSSLNVDSGRFTAGRSGLYQVSISARSAETEGDNQFLIDVVKEPSGGYVKIAQLSSETYTPLSATGFIQLNKGETAYLQYHSCRDSCYIDKLNACFSLYKEM